MSSLQTSADHATEPTSRTAVPMMFEVTTLPVADVDRAKDFYQRLGWRARHRLQAQPGRARCAVHPAGIARLDPVRRGHHDDGARFAAGHDLWSSTTS